MKSFLGATLSLVLTGTAFAADLAPNYYYTAPAPDEVVKPDAGARKAPSAGDRDGGSPAAPPGKR